MHKTARACAAVLTLAALSGAAQAEPAFDRLSAALAAGDGATARTLADAGLAEQGLSVTDHARLLMDRGFADQLLAQADTALIDLTQAIEIHGMTDLEQSRAYMERGIVLDSMGRIDDAIGDYSAVLRLDPGFLAALSSRANAYWREKRFEEARQDFLVSLAANNPAPEYSYYGLGQVAESEGKQQEAKDFYAKAVAADPQYSQAADRLAALGGAPAKAQAAIAPAGNVMAEALTPAPADIRAAATPAPPAAESITAQDAPVAPPPDIKTAKASPPATSMHTKAALPTSSPPVIRAAKSSPPSATAIAAAPPAPSLPPPDNAAEQVQLGSWRYQAEAETGWQRAVKKADGALAGLAPHIVIADVPVRGRYYRLRVETANGKQLCAILTAKGMDCALAGRAAATPKIADNAQRKR
jgi:tetratricopeptide (TPR) repeat protein